MKMIDVLILFELWLQLKIRQKDTLSLSVGVTCVAKFQSVLHIDNDYLI